MQKRSSFLYLQLASPNKIKSWGTRLLPNGNIIGQITKNATLNYKTGSSIMGGLFCEQIFGPINSWQCSCGFYKRQKYYEISKRSNPRFCQFCNVELTDSKVRRYRMGYIKLNSPVVHSWFLKNVPSYISIILDKSVKDLKAVVNFDAYITYQSHNEDDVDQNSLEYRWYHSNVARRYFPMKETSFKESKLMGGEAIKRSLSELNLQKISSQIKRDLTLNKSTIAFFLVRRLRLVNDFLKTRSKPEWMVISNLPVMPPDLRPIVSLPQAPDVYATSSLNLFYRVIINRNNRLAHLLKLSAPEMLIRREKRLLQNAVDRLIDNGKSEEPLKSDSGVKLPSLSDCLHGKKGRFRQNLLGKRVDFSARSVIIVEPNLQIFECGLPREIAVELFQPFIIQKLISLGQTNSIRGAMKLILQREEIIWSILSFVIKGHPILLNRAPTLHRLGIQSFQPVLNYSKAIQIHPLVCSSFNADFDGDQMAVHLPISLKAQSEARVLMLSSNNWLSPATGCPILTLSQDMVIGSYFLTLEAVSLFYLLSKIRFFSNFEMAIQNYNCNKIFIHSFVWIKLSQGDIYFNIKSDKVLSLDLDKSKLSLGLSFHSSFSYLRTTVGRILFNEALNSFI